MMAHYSPNLHYTGDRWSGFERVKVDAAQTSFFEGREFRAFHEFSIAGGASLTLRVQAAVPFVLFNQNLSVDAGGVKAEVFAATPGAGGTGPWTEKPVFGKNRMPERRFPYYESQVSVAHGGSLVGGTLTESFRAVSAGTGINTSTVGVSSSDERGLPASTYFIKLTALGSTTATGIYSFWWEERASHPEWVASALP